MKFLQKLGKALMLPVAVLAHLRYSHGYWLLAVSGNHAGWRYPGCSELNRSVLSESRRRFDRQHGHSVCCFGLSMLKYM